jgi:hypothetical protein
MKDDIEIAVVLERQAYHPSISEERLLTTSITINL